MFLPEISRLKPTLSLYFGQHLGPFPTPRVPASRMVIYYEPKWCHETLERYWEVISEQGGKKV